MCQQVYSQTVLKRKRKRHSRSRYSACLGQRENSRAPAEAGSPYLSALSAQLSSIFPLRHRHVAGKREPAKTHAGPLTAPLSRAIQSLR